MKSVPLFVDGEISFAELAEIFKSAGYQVRMVGSQIIVSRVPAWLLREQIAAPPNGVKIAPGIRWAR